uniref:Uncharacterized protein n=1 Tax=Timema genevievae TaxID=629358 RepID=A0A7R9K191_TIMGE|nr:unnamed protein product [Timema genevievae]
MLGRKMLTELLNAHAVEVKASDHSLANIEEPVRFHLHRYRSRIARRYFSYCHNVRGLDLVLPHVAFNTPDKEPHKTLDMTIFAWGSIRREVVATSECKKVPILHPGPRERNRSFLKVVQKLAQCVDDPKRLVRQAAVGARSRWFLVGAPGEPTVA